jgi:hypothetical protein
MGSQLLEAFAEAHPNECERRGGEVFVSVEAALRLLDEVERLGVAVLGLEGFVIGEATYPALSRIADFSRTPEYLQPDFARWSCAEARRVLVGPWSTRPQGQADQIHSDAEGRHMISIVLQDADPGSRDAGAAQGSDEDDAPVPVPLSAVAEALQELEGLTFWDGGRAADMKMFAFGSPRELPRRGGGVTVGQFALHLQCPWRLTQNGVTLTSHEDIAASTGSGGSASADRATNRCDEVIERLFASGAFTVVGASCQPLSDLTIACTNGLVLEVRVDADNAEQWRLFEPAEVPGQGLDHLVVERIDGDLIAAWE